MFEQDISVVYIVGIYTIVGSHFIVDVGMFYFSNGILAEQGISQTTFNDNNTRSVNYSKYSWIKLIL